MGETKQGARGIMEWTEALMERVKELWPTHSARQIADELGICTRNAVVGKLARMGLSVEQKTETHPQTRIKGQGREKNPRAKRSTANHDITLVRMVRGKGNSNNLRITTSREASDQYKIRCVEIVPRGLTIIDLEPGDCRYPYGDEAITFCGHPSYSYTREGSEVKITSSYCRPHYELTRQEPKPRRAQARLWSAA